MIHPATELRRVDPVIGYGVFATAPIARGTIIWALDPLDRVLTQAEIAALPPAVAHDAGRHLWLDRAGHYVLAWDLARFVNHSCTPNCVTTAFGCEIAVTDIAPGDQLTNDYADLGMLPGETMACGCGARRCRRIVASGQEILIRSTLAESAARAIESAGAVEQPLWPLLPDDVRAHLLVAQGSRSGSSRDWQIRKANTPQPLQRAAGGASRRR